METIISLLQFLVDSVYTSLIVLYHIIFDVLIVALLGLVRAAIQAVDVITVPLNLIRPTDYFTALPTEITGMLAAIRFNEGLSLVTTSLIIRFAFQGIPFVRFGSLETFL